MTNIEKIKEFINKNKKYILIIIFVILFILFISYLSYNYKKTLENQVVFIDKPTSFKKYKQISYDNIPMSKKNIQCSYSIWLYLENLGPSYSRKHGDNYFYTIFSKETNDSKRGSPGLYYRPLDSKLMVTIKTTKINKYIINHRLLLQKWNNIVVVIDKNNIDIYINKDLIISYDLGVVIDIGESNLSISKTNSSIYGKYSYFRYFNYALSPEDIEKFYDNTNKNKPTKPILWWLNMNILPGFYYSKNCNITTTPTIIS